MTPNRLLDRTAKLSAITSLSKRLMDGEDVIVRFAGSENVSEIRARFGKAWVVMPDGEETKKYPIDELLRRLFDDGEAN